MRGRVRGFRGAPNSQWEVLVAGARTHLSAADQSRLAQALAAPLDWEQLRLESVTYEHQPGLGAQGMSLALDRGQWIGISGPSGCGETTLVDLAAGLLEPQSGSVTVDGKPLAGHLLEQWRASLAYVGQDGSVFDDSVRGNLLAEGARADDDRLWAALAAVGLEERVRAFTRGLDERVGEYRDQADIVSRRQFRQLNDAPDLASRQAKAPRSRTDPATRCTRAPALARSRHLLSRPLRSPKNFLGSANCPAKSGFLQ